MPPFSFQLYMTFHSYGQYILYPWGYTDEGVPPNYRNLRSLAEVGAAAFRRESGGHRYTMGSAAQVLYPAAGERQQTLNKKNYFMLTLKDKTLNLVDIVLGSVKYLHTVNKLF